MELIDKGILVDLINKSIIENTLDELEYSILDTLMENVSFSQYYEQERDLLLSPSSSTLTCYQQNTIGEDVYEFLLDKSRNYQYFLVSETQITTLMDRLSEKLENENRATFELDSMTFNLSEVSQLFTTIDGYHLIFDKHKIVEMFESDLLDMIEDKKKPTILEEICEDIPDMVDEYILSGTEDEVECLVEWIQQQLFKTFDFSIINEEDLNRLLSNYMIDFEMDESLLNEIHIQ